MTSAFISIWYCMQVFFETFVASSARASMLPANRRLIIVLPMLISLSSYCRALKWYFREECEKNVCMYSSSRNDVPRVAQRYRTIAAHTRCRASVLVVFVVFCVHMHSFAGLIRRTPPPTFSDAAIIDHHSDTTNFQLRAHWVRISWSIGSEKSFGHVPPVGVEPSTSCVQGEHPIH